MPMMGVDCENCNRKLNALINAHGQLTGSHQEDEPCPHCDRTLNLLSRMHNANTKLDHAIA